MPIAAICPKCGSNFRLPDELAGRGVKCQKCQQIFRAPGAEDVGPSQEEGQISAAPPKLKSPPPLPKRRSGRSEKSIRKPASSSGGMMILLIALGGGALLSCIGCGCVGAWAFMPQPPRADVAQVKVKDKVIRMDDPPLKDPIIVNDGKILPPRDNIDLKKDDPIGDPLPPDIRKDRPSKKKIDNFKDKKDSPPIAVVFGADASFRDSGMLEASDPLMRADKFGPDKRHKTYLCQMDAKVTYQIDMIAEPPAAGKRMIDCYLYVFDGATMLAADDDGGGFPHARILFRPKKAGQYRIIATSLLGSDTGPYTLTVKTLNGVIR